MAMVIEERLRLSVVVIKSSRDIVGEQKIVVEEWHQKFVMVIPKRYISLGERRSEH